MEKGHTLRIMIKPSEGVMYAPQRMYPEIEDSHKR
jgi:hypothetical protein